MSEEWSAIPFEPQKVAEFVKNAAFKKAFKKVPRELWAIDADLLRRKTNPTATDRLLKNALWNEIRVCAVERTDVRLDRVYAGICTYQHWYHNVINNPLKMAWLLSPANELGLRPEHFVGPLLERLVEITKAPILKADGSLHLTNTRVLMQFLSILERPKE